MTFSPRRLVWTVLIVIILLGLMALFSASAQTTRVTREVFYNQLGFSAIGLVMIAFLSRFDHRRYYDFAYIAYGLNVLLLIAIFLFGYYALGAKRWIEFLGFNFQPSEFMKFSLILALARYYATRKPTRSRHQSWSQSDMMADFIVPLGMTAVPVILVFKQPDLGTALLLLAIFLVIAFAAGVAWKHLGGFLGLMALAAPVLWHMLKPYQKDRLLVFLNPNVDPLGAGYTIIQSKIAIGSGQIFGRGWLSGTQNQLNFLPERHTDFIFSVIGEEWGFVGSVFVVICFYILIMTSLRIVEQIQETFSYITGVGIVAIFAFQVVINIGMVLGLCPIVGITLPFMSYGRSSFLVGLLMFGFLFNLARNQKIF